VGEKTARLLVESYPDLPSLIADAKAERRKGAQLQRSPALRAAIREAAGYLTDMLTLVPIRTDVELKEWIRDRDEAKVDEVGRAYRLQGPIRRLASAMAR
jgi:hypothetical protein